MVIFCRTDEVLIERTKYIFVQGFTTLSESEVFNFIIETKYFGFLD